MTIKSYYFISLQIFLKPSYRLRKCLVLGPILVSSRQFSLDSEAVRHSTEQIDLVWLACFGKDILRLVSQVSCEYGIGFYSLLDSP